MLKVNKQTLEKGVKYFQSQQYRNKSDVSNVVLVPLLLILNMFHTFFFLPIIRFTGAKLAQQITWS